MKKTRGFSLVELMVIASLISLLISLVLASLVTARVRAQEAKVKSTLVNLRSAAEQYFVVNNYSYGSSPNDGFNCYINANIIGTVFSNSNIRAMIQSLDSISTTMTCFASDDTYVAAASLPGGGTWCVDHTFTSKRFGSFSSIDWEEPRCSTFFQPN